MRCSARPKLSEGNLDACIEEDLERTDDPLSEEVDNQDVDVSNHKESDSFFDEKTYAEGKTEEKIEAAMTGKDGIIAKSVDQLEFLQLQEELGIEVNDNSEGKGGLDRSAGYSQMSPQMGGLDFQADAQLGGPNYESQMPQRYVNVLPNQYEPYSTQVYDSSVSPAYHDMYPPYASEFQISYPILLILLLLLIIINKPDLIHITT